jgi:hypothetical protein
MIRKKSKLVREETIKRKPIRIELICGVKNNANFGLPEKPIFLGSFKLRAGQIQSIVQEARRSGTEIPIGGMLDRNGTGGQVKSV